MLKKIANAIQVPMLHRLAQMLTLAIYYAIFLGLYRLTIAVQKAVN